MLSHSVLVSNILILNFIKQYMYYMGQATFDIYNNHTIDNDNVSL